MTGLAAAPASRHQEQVVAEFRVRGARVGGYHAGLPLLLLTATGVDRFRSKDAYGWPP